MQILILSGSTTQCHIQTVYKNAQNPSA